MPSEINPENDKKPNSSMDVTTINLSLLDVQRSKKEKQLEHNYNVHIADEGEEIQNKLSAGQKGLSMIRAISPTYRQLCELEQALEISKMSLGDERGKQQLHICFLPRLHLDGSTSGGIYDTNLGGYSTVAFDMSKTFNIKEIAIHELTHRHQHRFLKWWEGGELQHIAAMGWYKSKEANIPLLVGKQGQYFRFEDQAGFVDLNNQHWTLCNQFGRALNKEGKVASNDAEKVRLSVDEVRNLASVTPASNYFTEPVEMYGDALEMFRKSTKSRSKLLQVSPKMYDLVKHMDQLEINDYSKHHYSGKKMIRMFNGLLAEATRENLTEVKKLEDQARHLPLK